MVSLLLLKSNLDIEDLDFATFLGWMPRDICSRERYLNREGVKNPCLVCAWHAGDLRDESFLWA